MRPLSRLLLLVILPLLSTACGLTRPSTPSSIARDERPKLPIASPDLTGTERLAPMSGRRSGTMVQIDQAQLGELTEGYAAAIVAVTRGNNRAAGNRAYQRCVKAVFETGVIPKNCPGGDVKP